MYYIIDFKYLAREITKSFTVDSECLVIKMAEESKKLNIDVIPTKITVAEALHEYINYKRNLIVPATLYGDESLAQTGMFSSRLTVCVEKKIYGNWQSPLSG